MKKLILIAMLLILLVPVVSATNSSTSESLWLVTQSVAQITVQGEQQETNSPNMIVVAIVLGALIFLIIKKR